MIANVHSITRSTAHSILMVYNSQNPVDGHPILALMDSLKISGNTIIKQD